MLSAVELAAALVASSNIGDSFEVILSPRVADPVVGMNPEWRLYCSPVDIVLTSPRTHMMRA